MTPLRQPPEMHHAANNSLTPSRSFRVTNKREPSVLTDQSCHRGEARCCGLTLYPQHYQHANRSGLAGAVRRYEHTVFAMAKVPELWLDFVPDP